MKIRSICIVFSLLVLMSSVNIKAAPIMRFAPFQKLKVIKAKSYQHDAYAIIWYDIRGNDTCDFAEFYEKEDGYFIIKSVSCKGADEIDKHILEPHI